MSCLKSLSENSIWNTTVPLLSYSCKFQVEICSQQLEICKSVCMFIVLAIALLRLINFRLFCSDDCLPWSLEEKINNHGCWGKHAHIPDNYYWGICLFHVVWTNLFLQLFLCGTHRIYVYFNLPERVQILGHAHIICITVWKTKLSAVKYFAICSKNLLLSGFLMLCSWF